MVTPVNSNTLIQEALSDNQSTLLMQCALLQKILEAKTGVAVDAPSNKKPVAPTSVPGASPVDDSTNPTDQGMILLGLLGQLDLLSNELIVDGSPAWVQTEYNQLVNQINQMLAGAPAGSIDPVILALAQKTIALASGPNGGPGYFLQAYENAINDLSTVDSNEPKGTTIADWINQNRQTFNVNNPQLAASIAFFMIDLEYNISDNDPSKPSWNPKLSFLASFWNSSNTGSPIPEAVSQAAANFLIYYLWVQAGSPSYSNPATPAWTNFMLAVSNLSDQIDPTGENMPWENPSGVTAGYNTFYQDFVNNVNSWSQNGPPSYASSFVSEFVAAWNAFLNQPQ